MTRSPASSPARAGGLPLRVSHLDRGRRSVFGGEGGDIFNEIFGHACLLQRPGAGGAGARRAQPGADINATLDVHHRGGSDRGQGRGNVFPLGGKSISVKLPAYVEDGQTIRLKGQGEPGLGGPGDALVKIRFRRHSRYRVEGRDLHADVEVPLAQAVLGAKVAVETPTGKVAVTVPAWSSSDKVLRLKGRGLPEKDRRPWRLLCPYRRDAARASRCRAGGMGEPPGAVTPVQKAAPAVPL